MSMGSKTLTVIEHNNGIFPKRHESGRPIPRRKAPRSTVTKMTRGKQQLLSSQQSTKSQRDYRIILSTSMGNECLDRSPPEPEQDDLLLSLLMPILYSKTSWGILIVFVLVSATSGQTWTLVRGAHVKSHPGETGFSLSRPVPVHVHPNRRFQYFPESLLVTGLNGLLVLSFLCLSQSDGITSGAYRNTACIASLTIVYVCLNVLSHACKMKYHPYPFL